MGENSKTKNYIMMEMNVIRNVAIAVAALGGVCLLYVNRKRLAGRFAPFNGRESGSRQERLNGDSMIEVCEAFLMYADGFQGLYEPLYKASMGKISLERMKNVFAEWDIRMGRIRNIPIVLRGWWTTIVANKDVLSYEELQERLQKVVQMIEGCGIVRDKQSELIAKADTNLYYQHDEDIRFEAGQKLRVESPCWYLPSNPVRIIEKGYAEIL